jgi:predicted Zn-dependent peptidase
MVGRDVPENTIYVMKDKKAVQSQIYFYVKGDIYSKDEFSVEHAFDEYFGGGFSGLAMQEIREYRSLAYSAGANYSAPVFDQLPGDFYAFIGCQADKSNEAIEVMQGLVTKMPWKKEREEMLQKSLLMKINTNFPDFKALPSTVRDWQMIGYSQDPNKKAASFYPKITMEDINQFYQKHVAGKPYVITVYGDLRRIDLARLAKLGKIIAVDKKDFFVD